MLSAISRYGARFVPEMETIVEDCRRRGELVAGPRIAEFEAAFAARQGGGQAVTTSYGRVAAWLILKTLDLPPGSEIVFPALTFWVVPEMARSLGLRVVFADVDPRTFNLDPESLARVVTPRTRAVVPTHIYGLPCDMDEILEVARRHRLKVVEDCAHALGASYHDRPVGTFGDAALFSFQVLKPLNTCGGGLAYTRDPAFAERLRALAARHPAPAEARVLKRLRLARVERTLLGPRAFSFSIFPVLWGASLVNARPDVYLWEKIRPLTPFPDGYAEGYSNVQAALGLAGLARLDGWTRRTRENAATLSEALRGVPGVLPPPAPDDRLHVYYQYPLYVPDRETVSRACLRHGLDVEYHHMDVCSDLDLFGDSRAEMAGARRTTEAIQVPVHAGLDAPQLASVVSRLRAGLASTVGGPGGASARLAARS